MLLLVSPLACIPPGLYVSAMSPRETGCKCQYFNPPSGMAAFLDGWGHRGAPTTLRSPAPPPLSILLYRLKRLAVLCLGTLSASRWVRSGSATDGPILGRGFIWLLWFASLSCANFPPPSFLKVEVL